MPPDPVTAIQFRLAELNASLSKAKADGNTEKASMLESLVKQYQTQLEAAKEKEKALEVELQAPVAYEVGKTAPNAGPQGGQDICIQIQAGIAPKDEFEKKLCEKSYVDKVLDPLNTEHEELIAWTPFQWPILLENQSRFKTHFDFALFIEDILVKQIKAPFPKPALLAELKALVGAISVLDRLHRERRIPAEDRVADLVAVVSLVKSCLLRVAAFAYPDHWQYTPTENRAGARNFPTKEEVKEGKTNLSPWLWLAISRRQRQGERTEAAGNKRPRSPEGRRGRGRR